MNKEGSTVLCYSGIYLSSSCSPFLSFPDPQAVCPRDDPVDGGGAGGGSAAADGGLSGPAESVLGDVLVGIAVLQ